MQNKRVWSNWLCHDISNTVHYFDVTVQTYTNSYDIWQLMVYFEIGCYAGLRIPQTPENWTLVHGLCQKHINMILTLSTKSPDKRLVRFSKYQSIKPAAQTNSDMLFVGDSGCQIPGRYFQICFIRCIRYTDGSINI